MQIYESWAFRLGTQLNHTGAYAPQRHMADDASLGPRLLVGLTGGIASGKSLVGDAFVKLGAPLSIPT